MAPKQPVTVSNLPNTLRPTSAQRRAAVVDALANQQATLKQEAAERQAKRDAAAESASATPRRRRPTSG